MGGGRGWVFWALLGATVLAAAGVLAGLALLLWVMDAPEARSGTD